MNSAEFWARFEGFRLKDEETPIEEGFLLREYRDQFEIADHRAKKNIKAMVDEGLIEACWIKRMNSHGVNVSRPGYRWIGE